MNQTEIWASTEYASLIVNVQNSYCFTSSMPTAVGSVMAWMYWSLLSLCLAAVPGLRAVSGLGALAVGTSSSTTGGSRSLRGYMGWRKWEMRKFDNDGGCVLVSCTYHLPKVQIEIREPRWQFSPAFLPIKGIMFVRGWLEGI